MATVGTALREFRDKYAAMLVSADRLHHAMLATASVVLQTDCTRGAFASKSNLVQRVTAEHFGLSVARMLSRDRREDIRLPRQVVMLLTHDLTRYGLERIAADFGGYDHGTVLNAIKSVRDRASIDRDFARRLELCRDQARRALELSAVAEGKDGPQKGAEGAKNGG